MKAPRSANEAGRLASLRAYEVLDTPSEAAFDDLTLLAAHICGVPTAMVSLVDENRQWFKSKFGISAAETSRDIAFCAHTILQPHQVLEVRDAEADPRFADSPLVTEDPHIRFYAGAPLVTGAGHALGALCVMDTVPRSLSTDQLAALEALSRRVVAQLELRRQARELVTREQEATRLLALAEKSRLALLSVLEDEKLAARNLRESEERFRNLIENASDMIAIIDEDGVIRYQSPSTPRVLGYAASTMLGRPASEFIHPDDRIKVGEAVGQALRTQDDPVTVEYRIQHQDGTWRVLQSSGKRMTGVGGKPQIVVNSRDITENRALEKQFLHAQRMEAIGTLAGGMAHDLNNILAPVLMVTGLLKTKLTSPQDQHILNMVENSAQRGAGIIRQLLMFSRGVAGERVAVQLRHLIKEMTDIMRETFPREITISNETPNSLWSVMGDATQLHQVLMNLCVNARDAMPKGGMLTIAARNLELGDNATQLHPQAKAGQYVVLSIEDTGQGIPQEIIGRIFDPFFTTKGVGKGTGLGLSTVIGIVKSHDGFVTVQSEPGKGTAFKVHLPVTKVLADAEPSSNEPSVPGQGELILVVDDEDPVSLSTRLILEQQNYRVLVAHNGKEALTTFVQHQNSIKVVLTDIMMPVMDGLALAWALRAIKPDIAIIAATGLDQEGKKAELQELGITEVLLKPCAPNMLLAAIGRALNRR